tara:strand:+ start:636 stop:902 length:267 start_codon:yes stop_codon:yes gene_type:complete
VSEDKIHLVNDSFLNLFQGIIQAETENVMQSFHQLDRNSSRNSFFKTMAINLKQLFKMGKKELDEHLEEKHQVQQKLLKTQIFRKFKV